MRDDIFEILTFAKKLGFAVDVSTNASLIDAKKAVLVSKLGLELVHVGLDGHNQATHASIRGKQTFFPTIAGIKELVKQQVYVRVGTVIFKGNQDYLEELILLCQRLGVQEVIFSLLEPVGRMKGDSSKLTSRSVAELQKSIADLQDKYAKTIKVSSSFAQGHSVKGQGFALCPGADKFAYIDPKGLVFPCPWVSQYFLPALLSGLDFGQLVKEMAACGLTGCPIQNLDQLNEIIQIKALVKDFEVVLRRSKKFAGFSQLYSFTTERLAAYYPNFEFSGKDVLVVGASGDHMINAYLLGAKNVTCFDINILAKYFVDLKIAGLKKLSYRQFLRFFLRSSKALSYNVYLNLRSQLLPAAKFFWDSIYKKVNNNGQVLRESLLFNNSFDRDEEKISNNLYLQSAKHYQAARQQIRDKKLVWFASSVEDICRQALFKSKAYDIILLSNLADYASLMFRERNYLQQFRDRIIKVLLDSLAPNGILSFAYLYDYYNKRKRSDVDKHKLRKKLFSSIGSDYEESFFEGAGGRIDALASLKKKSLCENSDSYLKSPEVYDELARSEDWPRKVLKVLAPLVKDKVVLDLGCGTGKYLELLSPHAKFVFGLDCAAPQLAIAKKRTRSLKNIKIIKVSAENIPLPAASVDMVIGCWFLGTIVDPERRKKILIEAKRILKKKGHIYLVENDCGGEFEEIRGRGKESSYNSWLLKEMNCKVHKRMKTYFKFADKDKAARILRTIWGNNVAKHVNRACIQHNVIIFVFPDSI